MPASYKAEVIADATFTWVSNALRFASWIEANAYAIDLAGRWTLVRMARVTESDDPVNARFENGRLVHLPQEPQDEPGNGAGGVRALRP